MTGPSQKGTPAQRPGQWEGILLTAIPYVLLATLTGFHVSG